MLLHVVVLLPILVRGGAGEPRVVVGCRCALQRRAYGLHAQRAPPSSRCLIREGGAEDAHQGGREKQAGSSVVFVCVPLLSLSSSSLPFLLPEGVVRALQNDPAACPPSPELPSVCVCGGVHEMAGHGGGVKAGGGVRMVAGGGMV